MNHHCETPARPATGRLTTRPAGGLRWAAAGFVACLLAFASGCEEEDPKLEALREQGVRYALDDEGNVSGLYFYSDEEHPFGDDGLALVQQFPSIKLLLVESNQVTDACLAHVKPLENLEELDLTFCGGQVDDSGQVRGGITDASVDVLQEMTRLKRIGLQATRVTDRGADRLQRALPDCRVDFNYSDPILAAMRRQGTDFVSTVRQMGAEAEFDDDGNVIDLKLGASDLALEYIGRLESLKSLTLRGAFTSAGLEHLTGLPHLESLDIADPFGRRDLDDDAMQAIVSHAELKSLDLSGNQIADERLQTLENLPGLEKLNVVGCLLSDNALKKLKEALPGCKVTYTDDPLLNALLNHAGDLPAAVEEAAHNVERGDDGEIVGVEFRLSRIGDKGLAELAKLDGLKRLHFVYCRMITDDGLRHVGQMAGLTSLTLSHVNLSDRGVARLAALAGLVKLDLTSNRVTSSSQRIGDGSMRDIASMKELQSLSLRGTDMTDTGLRRLDGLTKLTSLDVRGTGATEQGVQRLKEKLPDCNIVH